MQKTDNFRAATQPIGSYRRALVALLCATLFVSTSQAQRRVLAAGVQPNVSLVGGIFGDTVQHVVKILALDPSIEAASAYMKSPKHVVVLGVVPGKEIELISPGDMVLGSMGDNTFALVMSRFELTTVASQMRNDIEQREYVACTRERAAAIKQNAASARRWPAPRDSAARTAPPPREVPAADVPYCEMPTGETSGKKLARRQLPLRPEAERYLVVVTTSKEIRASDLEKRLQTLTVVTSNVRQTIEAIAAGLFAGSGDYGGAWVAW